MRYIDAIDSVQTTAMANIVFNVSNTTAISLYPAEYFTFYADAVIPANSSVFGLIDIALPIDGLSAVMTLVSLTVVRVCLLSLLPAHSLADPGMGGPGGRLPWTRNMAFLLFKY